MLSGGMKFSEVVDEEGKNYAEKSLNLLKKPSRVKF